MPTRHIRRYIRVGTSLKSGISDGVDSDLNIGKEVAKWTGRRIRRESSGRINRLYELESRQGEELRIVVKRASRLNTY
jgi:hypothetical protein